MKYAIAILLTLSLLFSCKKDDTSDALPEADLTIGTTRVNLHLQSDDKNINSATLFCQSFFGSYIEQEAAIDKQTGTATFEFRQYGTAKNFIWMGEQCIFAYTSPGETIDLYTDLQQGAFRSTGKYAAINRILNNQSLQKFVFNIESEEALSEIAGMDADAYTVYMSEKFKVISDSIHHSDLSGSEKEFFLNENKMNIQTFLILGTNQLERAYRFKNNISWEQTELEGFQKPVFSEKHYATLKNYRIEGTKYLFTSMFPYMSRVFFEENINLKDVTGENEGFLYDLKKVYTLPHKANSFTPLTEEEKEDLASIREPFYANVISDLETIAQKQMEDAKNKTGYTIRETPDVSNEELFDAIAAGYKEQVVLVDFWATWCSPCLSSIKKTEALKSTRFKDTDIAFVYITDETSPEAKWHATIADITGDHYRLTETQWKHIYNKLGLSGRPSYIIISRDGKYHSHKDFIFHEVLIKALTEIYSKQ